LVVLQVDLNESLEIAAPSKGSFRPVVRIAAETQLMPPSKGLDGWIDIAEWGFEPFPFLLGTIVTVGHGCCLANVRLSGAAATD
jgi:hypothetical protein